MGFLLLVTIYLAFIAMGLYVGIFGAIWPIAYLELGVPIALGSIYPLVSTIGTLIATMTASRLQSKFPIWGIVTLSMAMLSASMLGFYIAPSFYIMLIIVFIRGFFSGNIDIILNSFMTMYYRPHFTSFGHGFWGLGAMISPLIASYFIGAARWRSAYIAVGIIQLFMVVVLFAVRHQWEEVSSYSANLPGLEEELSELHSGSIFRLKGVIPAVIAFVAYSGIENTANNWGSSFLVSGYGLSADVAAKYISIFFAALTIGRFTTGFLAIRFSYKKLIFFFQAIVFIGVVPMMLPFSNAIVLKACFALIGFGSAAIYPSMLNQTPQRFGKKNTPRMVNTQMSASFLGGPVLIQFVGLLSGYKNMIIVPVMMFLCIVVNVISNTWVTISTSKNSRKVNTSAK